MMVMGDRSEPLYMISVVARMLKVHPQTLRMYEREGLITPRRISRQRLYSADDIERLGMILRLTKDLGVNRAGVDIILRLRGKIERLGQEMELMMPLLESDIQDELRLRLRAVLGQEEE